VRPSRPHNRPITRSPKTLIGACATCGKAFGIVDDFDQAALVGDALAPQASRCDRVLMPAMLSASIVQPGSHINAYAAAGGHVVLAGRPKERLMHTACPD